MRCFFLIVLSCVWASVTWAGLVEGSAAYLEKNYPLALKEFRQAAAAGNAKAQFLLGVMYENGQGVAQDSKEAVAWYRKAAEQGYALAQTYLGAMYAIGKGVAQDDKEAVAWYRKAAEQGNADALYRLGAMYYEGRGVAQDDKEAVAWFRKSAEQGNTDAQTALGVMYEYGRGVVQDYKEAVTWYRKAAEQGNAFAQNNLGLIYQNGQAVSKSSVIAYALYNLSYANDPSPDNKAGNNRKEMMNEMSTTEVEAGQALTARLAKPGMFITALDVAEKSLPKLPVAKAPKPEPAAVPSSKSAEPKGGDCRPRTSQLRCQSQCYNGDCEVTYENGCKMRVQVNPKFDALSNRWKYPSPSC